jgi:two-component system cell cycle sensor histidine kinase/response regulator CckA
VMQPRLLDLSAVVHGTESMLSRLLGPDHRLDLRLVPMLSCVRADPGQLEQVLLNLVLNARDATPPGGSIRIETMSCMLDDEYMRRHVGVEIAHGAYNALIVTDSGHGMDRETQARVFEPFFSTKPIGEGTGLGLSTAYGIVKQNGGFIWVYSEPDLGTTFKVYLPAIHEPAAVGASVPAHARPLGGRETILVVEDEEMVRVLTCRMLRERGYVVHEAAHGEEALALLTTFPDRPALVLTDVVMPVMGGRELGARIGAIASDLPILYMSGFTGDDVVRRGLLEPGAPFQQKPFHPDELSQQIRGMLDARKSGGYQGGARHSPTPAAAHPEPLG